MTNTDKLGKTQAALFPIADELIHAGRLILALKTIIYATRVDVMLVSKAASNARYNRKIIKAMMKSVQIEAEACAVLHNH